MNKKKIKSIDGKLKTNADSTNQEEGQTAGETLRNDFYSFKFMLSLFLYFSQ